MYLTDEELPIALAELRRVVRPGGLVTAKESDGALFVPYPIDLALYAPVNAAVRRAIPGCQRGRGLRHWFVGAGLVEVWQRTTLIERWAPLRPVEHQFLGDALAFDAGVAEGLALPGEALDFWRAQRDPDAPEALVNRPDFSSCEGVCVVVGRVPADPARQ